MGAPRREPQALAAHLRVWGCEGAGRRTHRVAARRLLDEELAPGALLEPLLRGEGREELVGLLDVAVLRLPRLAPHARVPRLGAAHEAERLVAQRALELAVVHVEGEHELAPRRGAAAHALVRLDAPLQRQALIPGDRLRLLEAARHVGRRQRLAALGVDRRAAQLLGHHLALGHLAGHVGDDAVLAKGVLAAGEHHPLLRSGLAHADGAGDLGQRAEPAGGGAVSGCGGAGGAVDGGGGAAAAAAAAAASKAAAAMTGAVGGEWELVVAVQVNWSGGRPKAWAAALRRWRVVARQVNEHRPLARS